MTPEQRQAYRDAARAAQTAVACGRMAEAVDLVGAQPRVVLELLDYIDKVEREAVAVIEDQRAVIARMRPAYDRAQMIKVHDDLTAVVEAMGKGLRQR